MGAGGGVVHPTPRRRSSAPLLADTTLAPRQELLAMALADGLAGWVPTLVVEVTDG
jgi:hypothetical protein